MHIKNVPDSLEKPREYNATWLTPPPKKKKKKKEHQS